MNGLYVSSERTAGQHDERAEDGHQHIVSRFRGT
jgi:hypothetical protein